MMNVFLMVASVVLALQCVAVTGAVTVTESVSTDTKWPGPKPFRGAFEMSVQTVPAAFGKAKLVIYRATDKSKKENLEFVGEFDKSGLATFKTDLDPSIKYQYRRTVILSMSPKAKKDIKVGPVTARVRTSQAEALEMDVEGGDFMHVIHDASEPQTLVFRNPTDETLSWKGEASISEYFGQSYRLPVGITLAAGEIRRIPLSFDFSKKGVWRVNGVFTAGDGSTATKETRFAVLDRHEETPKLAKPKFRMGINYHVGWYSPEHREKTRRALVASGAKLARIGILSFADREREKGVFDWETSDAIIDELERAGIAMNSGVYCVPAWARDPRFDEAAKLPRGHSVPSKDGLFRDYCRIVAARYGTRIDYYECGNEWDLVPPEILPIDRALQMQKECYEGIKAGCPDACVIPNGWTLPDSDSWLGRKATNPGINEAFAEKAQGWYDVHPIHLHCNFETYENFIQKRQFPFFRRFNITKPWYANETALNSLGGTEDRTAKHVWMKILYSWAWGSTDYIWYNLKAKGWDGNNSETAYGLIRADYRPLATYAAFSALSAALQGMDVDKRLIDKKTRHVYRFRGETISGFKGIGIAGWDTALHDGATNVAFRTDACRAWQCDLMGNRTVVDVVDGKVIWIMGSDPSVLLLEGATGAELADPDAFTDVPDAPLPKRRVSKAGRPGRNPDFTINQFWWVFENYKADPEQQHRCWHGIEDQAAKFWLGLDGETLKVRVEVTDDVHVPSGDAVEIVVKTAKGEWKDRFADGVRKDVVTTYEIAIPFDEAGISAQDISDGFVFGAKVREDDGYGDDGYIFVTPTVIRFE